MTAPQHSARWRPRPSIRPIAVGVIWRGSELLLMAVRSDDGAIKGWRPLGGGIEFGERAVEALKRELAEELGVAVSEPRFLATLENIYEHEGLSGHEIVFVFETSFVDANVYSRKLISYLEGSLRNDAEWVALNRFTAGRETLFPLGLIELLSSKAPA